jgi:hypothetical protein
MPAMLSKLYHALLGAGVDDATATAAAEEAAQSDARFASLEVKITQVQGTLEARLNTMQGTMDTKFAALQGELVWLKWMVGTLIVLVLGVLWKVVK